MSVETGSRTEAGAPWERAAAGAAWVPRAGPSAPRPRSRVSRRCAVPTPRCAATRCFDAASPSPTCSALVGAFLLTLAVSPRSLSLGWAHDRLEIPILLIAAKMTGLYDRDETLLRKTTLDEAPRLFQLATLCTVLAWLAGGDDRPRRIGRHSLLVLWLASPVLLILFRSVGAHRRAEARPDRALPVHRRRDVRGDDPLASSTAAAASRRRSSPTSISTRSRRGRATRSPSPVSPRSATSRRRSTCIARSSRRAAPTRARC